MKNILVTGGCGFIGSNFVKIITKGDSDYFPVILDSLTYAGNENNISGLDNKSYTFVKGDICNKSLVDSLFEKYCFAL